MVEHAAVNRGVVGSSPTRGARLNPVLRNRIELRRICFANSSGLVREARLLAAETAGGQPVIWLRGQAVKTSPFHGGNTGSIPVGVTLI